MTVYRGNSGVLKLGASLTAVAELTGFTITGTGGTLDDTSQGDAARTFVPDGLTSWSGSMTGHYFPGDTGGRAVVVEGALLAMEAAPLGDGVLLGKMTGSIIITSIEIGSNNGAIVPFTAQFQGTGPLDRGLSPWPYPAPDGQVWDYVRDLDGEVLADLDGELLIDLFEVT